MGQVRKRGYDADVDVIQLRTGTPRPTGRGVTLWEWVASDLEADIEAGRLKAGARLAPEVELGARFLVSRATLRQALRSLESRGLVVPHAGRGWFVAERRRSEMDVSFGPMAHESRPLYEPPGQLLSYTDMARSRGLTADSVVLEQIVRPATLSEGEVFGIAPGADVFSLRRVRRLDRLATAIDRSLIAARLLREPLSTDYSKRSLHEALHQAGVDVVRADYTMTAIAADQESAALLDVALGFPLLAADQLMYDEAGRVIEKGYITYRSDRYQFRAVQRI
jgi:GntR family transcriptional regulator